VTKDEKTLELVQRAVAHLKILPPPLGVTEASSIKAYYAIFDGPARWKPGIRTPLEEVTPPKKSNRSFKIRE
jgi:hypothetical protein